jgi:hypothetical protein
MEACVRAANWDELITRLVGYVADVPVESGQAFAQLVRTFEVAARARELPLLREFDDTVRWFDELSQLDAKHIN